MRALSICTHASSGGAARAAYRLVEGLRDLDCSVGILAQHRENGDFDCIEPQPDSLGRIVNRLRYKAEHWANARYLREPTADWSSNLLPDRSVVRAIKEFAPDIVHLHWIGGGFLPIPALAKLNLPIVWTLHDMWPFTGGCHYSGGCQGYRVGCGGCPLLGSQTSHDLSRVIWAAKNRYWNTINLTIVSPSNWMADCARASSLFGRNRVAVIPNGLDTERFRPFDNRFAREALGLAQDRRLILFGAVRARDNARKGYAILQAALGRLATLPNPPELVVFGASGHTSDNLSALPTRFLGNLRDDVSLALLYSACDLFVAPSLEENLSNVVMEAMACGTPCVAFSVGGMPDLIDHLANGYLARPNDSDDLADGIRQLLEVVDLRRNLGAAARLKAETQYAIGTISRRYFHLYQSLLEPEHP